jgi:hypothetical protein
MNSLMLFVAAQAAASQVPAPAPAAAAPAAAIISSSQESVLRSGTPVALTMSESITTNGKKLRVGQRVRLAVASDVRLGTSVVIPAGSLAEGEIPTFVTRACGASRAASRRAC